MRPGCTAPYLYPSPEYQVLLETAEAARSGSTEVEATTPAKQLLPPAVGAGDLAAETDVSCCLGFTVCCCTCKQ